MLKLQKGDRVVCINDKVDPRYDNEKKHKLSTITKGKYYTISEYVGKRDLVGAYLVKLVGKPHYYEMRRFSICNVYEQLEFKF